MEMKRRKKVTCFLVLNAPTYFCISTLYRKLIFYTDKEPYLNLAEMYNETKDVDPNGTGPATAKCFTKKKSFGK